MQAVAMNWAPANWTPRGDIEKNRGGSNHDRNGNRFLVPPILCKWDPISRRAVGTR